MSLLFSWFKKIINKNKNLTDTINLKIISGKDKYFTLKFIKTRSPIKIS